MDDIVTRLRDEWGAHDQTSRDAADEIERLRTRCDTLRAHADRLASELARLHARDYCEDGCAITDALYAWQQARLP